MFITTDLVQGWQEGLRLMRLGDEFELTLPHTLAYGPQGAGGVIPAFSAIVFRMELTGFDEIGGGALDLWVWKGVVLMQRNLWGPVRVWWVLVFWFLFTVAPAFGSGGGKKGKGKGEGAGEKRL